MECLLIIILFRNNNLKNFDKTKWQKTTPDMTTAWRKKASMLYANIVLTIKSSRTPILLRDLERTKKSKTASWTVLETHL